MFLKIPILLSNSSERDFVCNSPSELKICNFLSSQSPSAVNKSSVNVKSLSNDDRLLQSKRLKAVFHLKVGKVHLKQIRKLIKKKN